MSVSFDIGTKYIKIAVGSAKKQTISVNNTYSIKIPSELSVGTPISQITAITDMLKNFLRENKIKKQPCAITISDDRFLIREMTLPKGSPKELKGMAHNEMISTHSAKASDITEVKIINRTEDGRLLVRAASYERRLVEAYYKLIQDLDLKPKSLTFHSDSISRLMQSTTTINNNPTEHKSFILIDTGMFACIAHVYEDGKPKSSRYMPIGFSDLFYYMTDRTALDEDKTVFTPSFRINSGLYNELPVHVQNQTEIFINRLADEISKLLRQLSSGITTGSFSPDYVYLFGGNGAIEGLDERLGSILHLNVSKLESVSGIKITAGCDDLIYFFNAAAALC